MKPQSLIKHCHCTSTHLNKHTLNGLFSFLLLCLWPMVPGRRSSCQFLFYFLFFKNGSWGLPNMSCDGFFPLCFLQWVSWLAGGLYGFLWPILVCQYAIYLQMSIHINEFLRESHEHDPEWTILCLCMQTVHAVVIPETSCFAIYVTCALVQLDLCLFLFIYLFLLQDSLSCHPL